MQARSPSGRNIFEVLSALANKNSILRSREGDGNGSSFDKNINVIKKACNAKKSKNLLKNRLLK